MRYWFVGILILVFSTINAQNFEIKQSVIDYNNRFKDGKKAMSEEKFDVALEFFRGVYEEDPANEQCILQMGICFHKMSLFDSSRIFLEKITPPFKDPYIQLDYTQYLAENQVRFKNYKEAAKLYKSMLKMFLPEDKQSQRFKLYRDRSKMIKNLARGRVKLDTIFFKIKEMPAYKPQPKLNYFAPQIIDSALELYQRADKFSQIKYDWRTKRHRMSSMSQLDSLEGWNHHWTYGLDSNFIYYAKTTVDPKTKIQRTHIYFSEYSDTAGLYNEKIVPFPINQEGANSTHPQFIAALGKYYLLYASNHRGSKGGYDIWLSPMKKGAFGRPKNLSKLNTVGDEITPNYNQLKTEYSYSSNHKNNVAGFDIFTSKSKNAKTVSPPKRLPFPFNTEYDDYYYKSYHDSTFTMISNRNIGEGDNCCNQVYYHYKPPAIDTTSSETCKQEIQLMAEENITLYFGNDMPNPGTRDTNTNYTYNATFLEYQQILPNYIKKYKKSNKEAEEIWNTYFEEEVKANMRQLTEFTKGLVDELERGNRVDIQIKGYASSAGKSDYNVNLTKRRIQTFINHMSEYQNGKFKPYLNNTASNGGVLKIQRLPFGDANSQEVEEQNKYGIVAASDRKIEVVSAKVTKQGILIDTTYEKNISIVRPPAKIFERSFNLLNSFHSEIAIQEVLLLDEKSPAVLTEIPESIPKCGQATIRMKLREAVSQKFTIVVVPKDSKPYRINIDLTIKE